MERLPILLVDDEDGIRTVLTITLDDVGYPVDAAPDVDSALKIFREKKHPLVITDIKMPGKSGIDLLREVKEIAPESEVIMITGHGDMELAVQSLKNNAFDFISKPINDDVLVIALERATERILMRRQLADHTRNLEAMVKEKSDKIVKVERQFTACQLFMGLTNTLETISSDFDAMNVFNQMPLFFSIHNQDKEVVSSNEHYKMKLGDLTGKPSWSMYEELKQEQDCPVCKTFETGKPVRGNYVVRCVNDNKHHVIVDTIPITSVDDGVELVLEFMFDYAQAGHLRAELHATQAKYQKLFDATPCYTSVQDMDLTIASINTLYREKIGDYEGMQCYEKLMHRRTPCVDCPVQKTFEDGKSHQLETVFTNRKGEKLNALIWSAPLVDEDGEVIQVMEMITDITQIRKLQDRLTTLGLLLGSTAHGIKGLLTGVDGAIYRLGSGIEKKNFDRIEDSFGDLQFLTDRIKNTVLDILYYAKKRELNAKKVDVGRFTLDLYASFAGKAKMKDIIIDLDMAAALGEFTVDASILSSALGNILENGIDACAHHKPMEGRVTLKVSNKPKEVVFQIDDNGVGMDRETCEKMFTLFFSSKGSAGTGLGTFVANEIVNQHSGSITVESEPGEGTVFTITIPRGLRESV